MIPVELATVNTVSPVNKPNGSFNVVAVVVSIADTTSLSSVSLEAKARSLLALDVSNSSTHNS